MLTILVLFALLIVSFVSLVVIVSLPRPPLVSSFGPNSQCPGCGSLPWARVPGAWSVTAWGVPLCQRVSFLGGLWCPTCRRRFVRRLRRSAGPPA